MPEYTAASRPLGGNKRGRSEADVDKASMTNAEPTPKRARSVSPTPSIEFMGSKPGEKFGVASGSKQQSVSRTLTTSDDDSLRPTRSGAKNVLINKVFKTRRVGRPKQEKVVGVKKGSKRSRHAPHSPKADQVTLVSENGKSFQIESEKLKKRSTFFRNLFELATPDGTRSDPIIPIDATADVVALFLDLVQFPFDLKGRSVLKATLPQIVQLRRLADKYDAEEIEHFIHARLDKLDPWVLLQSAHDADDVPMARCAIARLGFRIIERWHADDNLLWAHLKKLRLEWQVAMLRCLAPGIRWCYSSTKGAVVYTDLLRHAAEYFQPSQLAHSRAKKSKDD